MRTQRPDTLAASEAHLREVTIAFNAACYAFDLWALSYSMPRLHILPWMALAATCLLLAVHNVACMVANGTTFGSMPVATFSVFPASLAALLSVPHHGLIWYSCLVAGTLSLACVGFFGWWYLRMARACTDRTPMDEDAVLVVLGGSIRCGSPVPTVVSRLDVAAKAWRESPRRTIVVTGGPTEDQGTTEAGSMARWLEDSGAVPTSAILRETEALNTEQNVVLSKALLDREGLGERQLWLVSSDYHLYRATALARKAGIEVHALPAPVPLASRPQQWGREALVIVARRHSLRATP